VFFLICLNLGHQNLDSRNSSKSTIILPYPIQNNVSNSVKDIKFEVFIFNLSSVASSEAIVGVQLKVDRVLKNSQQKVRSPSTPWKISVAIYGIKKQSKYKNSQVS